MFFRINSIQLIGILISKQKCLFKNEEASNKKTTHMRKLRAVEGGFEPPRGS